MKYFLALSTVLVMAWSYNAYGGQLTPITGDETTTTGGWQAITGDETTTTGNWLTITGDETTTTTETLCGTTLFDPFKEKHWTSNHKCGSNIVDLLEDVKPHVNKRCSDNVVSGQVIMTHPPIYNCQDLLDSQKIDDDAERKRIEAIVREVLKELKKLEKFKKKVTEFNGKEL
jgi:hypothetical protein